MRRKAILLYHEDAGLMTGKDVNDMKTFLCSPFGGAWEPNEVDCRKNISLSGLQRLVCETKEQCYDYLVFYFSGHGGCARGDFLELNPTGETVEVRELLAMSTRQLSMFDCCRAYPVNEKMSFALDALNESHGVDRYRAIAREFYDERVSAALQQSMVLYACREGEYAHDFGHGGVYTQNLLDAARSFDGSVLLASQAHLMAYQPTVEEALKHKGVQHPDLYMAKLPSRYQLPFALNPNLI